MTISTDSEQLSAQPSLNQRGQALLRRYWNVGFVLATLVVAALAWQTYATRQSMEGLRQELAKRLAEVDHQSQQTHKSADELREAMREAAVKLGVLESKLAASQNQQIALEALYQDLSRNRDEWIYAEIEQTLLMASQQLQLAGNVKAALIGLQATDSRLQAMNRPQLTGLRKAIFQDIEKLTALPLIDTVGMSLKIDTLLGVIEHLPLAAETRPAGGAKAKGSTASPAMGGTWVRFWQELWTDIKQLVQVQRLDGTDVALLAPDQTFFLKEHLKLRLLTARVALLNRDGKTFNHDVMAVKDWLSRYFDLHEPKVMAFQGVVNDLQKEQINLELPDISTSLDALHKLVQSRSRGAP
ncbi:MAG: uroporphyrinogen-III C-methyltransferase [Betaproteobacteria bacterium]|jgi:uroporphyrin-3 C-methyltransferase